MTEYWMARARVGAVGGAVLLLNASCGTDAAAPNGNAAGMGNAIAGGGAASAGTSSGGAGSAAVAAGAAGSGGSSAGSSAGGAGATSAGAAGLAGIGGTVGGSGGGGGSGGAVAGGGGTGGEPQVVPPLELDNKGAYVRTAFTATSLPEAKPVGQRVPPSGESLDPKNVFDGSLQSRWGTGVYQVGAEVFVLDMHQLVKFSKLTLDPGSADEFDCPGKADVYVSNDGSSWGTPVVKDHVPKDHLDTITLPSQLTARYVKLVNTVIVDDHHWWAIGELNVYP